MVARVAVRALFVDDLPGRGCDVAKHGAGQAEPGRDGEPGALQTNEIGCFAADSLWREVPGVRAADDARVNHDCSGF